MSIAPRVPLMKPGSTVRNVVVVLGYIFLSFIWIPLLLVALPFIAAYKVYTGAWSAKLSKLPGIEPGGGAVPALAAFAYVFVAVAVVGAVAGGGGGGDVPEDSTAALDDTPTADARETASATQTQTDGGSDATATPEPTATATPEPTASPTPAPIATVTSDEQISEADFRAVLEAQGVDVVLFQRNSNEERGYVLAYRSSQTTEEGIAQEMGTVAGTWAAFVEANGEDNVGEGLIVQIQDVNGEPAGYYEIKTEWAVQYNEGELTAEEYSILILRTIEVVE